VSTMRSTHDLLERGGGPTATPDTHDARPDPTAERRLATTEVGAFLAIAAMLSIGSSAGAAALGADLRHLEEASPAAQTLLFGAAFIPVVAAVAARWLTGQRVRGAAWGWRRPAASAVASAWLAPLAYAGAAGALVWVLGLGSFVPSELAPSGLGALGLAIAAVTAGAVPFAALALGEELAWRGTFAARMSQLTTPFRAALATGVLWSLFHWPMMLLVPGAVEGAPTAWAVACFTVAITASSFPLHRLWMRTGSVWPAVVFHAAHNAAVYFVTDPLTGERSVTAWFAGETGLALAVTTVAAAVVLWRRWEP